MVLIDKDKVVVEIKRRVEAHKETLKNCDSSIFEMVLKGSMSAYQSFLHFLDTLEVEEVNLEKELGKYLDGNDIEFSHQIKLLDFAKHFYELGLKARKGE